MAAPWEEGGQGASAGEPPQAVSATVAFLRAALIASRDPSAAPLPAAGVDGEGLRAVVERERLGPLLHRVLAARPGLSAPTRAALREAYRATAMRNLALLHALGDCLQRLAAVGVDAVVLKGAALLQPAYGSLALRPMADLDILIQRDDLPRARAALEAAGFRPKRLETHPGVIAAHENELAFIKAGQVDVELDVHWSLFDSPFYQRQLTLDWFWHSARVQSLGPFSARTLGANALLLHLCAHLMLHHRGIGLLWWNDIAQVIHVDGERIDWDEAVARSAANQLLLPMRAVLTGLAREWQAPIPDEVLRRFAAARPGPAESDLFAQLTARRSPLQRFWTDLRDMADWRERLHYARSSVLPSPAFMRGRFGIRHGWMVPFYYPWRWLRALRGNLGRKRA